MKKITFAIIGIAAIAAVSCSKEEIGTSNPASPSKVSFTAVNADFTKTTLDGVCIKWSAADSITVFTAADEFATGAKFTVESVSPNGHTATFTGFTAISNAYIAAYPCNSSLKATATSVSGIVIPTIQTAVAGGFADGSNPSVATAASGSDALLFKNVGAIVGFQVAEAGISTVILSSDNAIAGTADVTITEGVPAATLTKGSKQVKLTGTFEVGSKYFFVVAPGTLANPKLTFIKEGQHAILSSAASKTVSRNGNYNMGTVTVPAAKWVPNGISTPADLCAFSDAVNTNAFLDIFIGTDGEINVLNNIDMKDVDFTPIGTTVYATGSYLPSFDTIFQGVFDGQEKTIDNLVVDLPATAAAGASSGLFSGAYASTIKNVVLGSGCKFTSEAAQYSEMGSVVGVSFNTKVTNCVSYATVSYDGGTVDKMRQSIGGIVGHMGCSSAEGKINGENASTDNCTFYGTMTSKNAANTNNGGTGISFAGIVGFTECTKAKDGTYPNYNKIDNCVNRGSISGQATRMGGVLASANNGTHVLNCKNYGTVSGSDVVAANSRVGGIVSTLNARTDVEGCTNYGTVEFTVAGNTDQGYASGVVGQVNDNSNYIKNCANYGIVRSDIFNNVVTNARYIGIILGNPNSKTVKVSGCKVGGIISPLTDFDTKKVDITAENFSTYITYVVGTRNKLVLENNTFSAGE